MIIKKIQLYAETIKPLLEWIKDNPNDKDVKYTVTRLLRFYSNTPKELTNLNIFIKGYNY